MFRIPKKYRATCYGTLRLPANRAGLILWIRISVLSGILLTPFLAHSNEAEIVRTEGYFTEIIALGSVGIISEKSWWWERKIPFILIGSAIVAVSLLSLTNIRGTRNLFVSRNYCCP